MIIQQHCVKVRGLHLSWGLQIIVMNTNGFLVFDDLSKAIPIKVKYPIQQFFTNKQKTR